MKTEQRKWTASLGWSPALPSNPDPAQLVLVFGATSILKKLEALDTLRGHYPDAQIIGCSTAGEICGTLVSDDSLVATADGDMIFVALPLN